MKSLIQSTRNLLRFLRHAGWQRFCPCCEKSVRAFLPFGLDQRADAQCPICGSLERHRLIWHYFRHRSNLFDGTPKRMLHFAPEPCFAWRLTTVKGLEHVTADLEAGRAMVAMDITNIPGPESQFDVVHCSHVLEHVPEDRKALSEIHRVLREGGFATIQIPVGPGLTDEDPSVKDPAEREQRFGQFDHVRAYGTDVINRFRDAGFLVSEFTAAEVVGSRFVKRLGIAHERLFVCNKRHPRAC